MGARLTNRERGEFIHISVDYKLVSLYLSRTTENFLVSYEQALITDN